MRTSAAYSLQPPTRDAQGHEQIRVVVRATGASIGTVQLCRAPGRVEIANLQVAREHRRQGVGKMLMQAAVDRVQRQGLVAVLEARPSDGSIPQQALVSMYQRLGFHVTGSSHRGSPYMQHGHAVAQPKMPPHVAAARPVVQPARKKLRVDNRPQISLGDLSNELLLAIMRFLADLDLARIAQVSHTFHNLLPYSLLQNMRYTADPSPIRGPGQAKAAITDQQHLQAAAAAMQHAFGIRNRDSHRIVLYRVSDKKTLTKTETQRYVVPGPFWTVEKTAAWILAGMFSRLPFVLITPPVEQSSYQEGDIRRRGGASGPSIYAREILQLLQQGYSIDYAGPTERPHQYRARADLLILRPPRVHRGTIAKTRTSLDLSIWDRTQQDSSMLIATVDGIPITAESLHEWFQREIEALQDAVECAALYFAMEQKRRDRDDEDPPGFGGGGGNNSLMAF